MGLHLRFLLGIITGIGLVKALARSQQERSRRRSELAATIAAFSKMSIEDLKKILPVQNYPSWVAFTEYHKLEWLNREVRKLWPFINEAASGVIKASVEPVLEQHKSTFLSSLKFTELTLGTVAPQFTGVCLVEDDDRDGITMELDFQWDGNPSIILSIQTTLGVSLPIQVKDIGFTGVFRLIFKPLVDQLPCIGAICFSLRKRKRLDFTLKVVGGEISSIPWLSSAIEETIHYALEDSITWPLRKIIPIIPGDYSDLEMKPVGRLWVRLIRAKDLTNKAILLKSDPFAKLYVRPLPDLMRTSRSINNDLNPIWNEHFEYIVEDPSTQHLVVKVYDDGGIQSAQLIGCAQVPLKDLQPGKMKDVWLKLVDNLEVQRDAKYRGQVHMELCYCSFNMEHEFSVPFLNEKHYMSENNTENTEDGYVASDENSSSQKKRDGAFRGVLTVTVHSAESLPASDVTGKADAYVMLLLREGALRNKTTVVHDSLNPFWNQTFDFVVDDGLHDMLILEIWDEDTLGEDYIGRCIMTLTRVIMEGEVAESYPLEGAASGKLNLHLKWVPQSNVM